MFLRLIAIFNVYRNVNCVPEYENEVKVKVNCAILHARCVKNCSGLIMQTGTQNMCYRTQAVCVSGNIIKLKYAIWYANDSGERTPSVLKSGTITKGGRLIIARRTLKMRSLRENTPN